MPPPLLLLLLLLLLAGSAIGQDNPVICVEDAGVLDLVRADFSLPFVLLPVAGGLETVADTAEVLKMLRDRRCNAVISDYYVSLAIATNSTSPSTPYFIIRKKVLDYPPKAYNTFEIEVDNFHLSRALYDMSIYYKRSSFVIVSDGSADSAHFFVYFETRPFTLLYVTNATSDAEIFEMVANQTLSAELAWILLFSEQNLPLMQRTLQQAARAGALIASQQFFIPSLFAIESQMAAFYQSSAQFYTFRLPGASRYTQQQLLRPFVIDCVSHFVQSYQEARSRRVGLIETLATKSLMDNATRSGTFAYSAIRVRSSVHLLVMRSNSSANAAQMFASDGSWTENGAPAYQPLYARASDISRSLIRFAALQTEPYVYTDLSNASIGLGMEIVQALSAALGFKYEIVEVTDGFYGTRLPDGSWNGIMRLLVDNEADVSVNLMTPSAERLMFADKSIGLAQDGIQMMARKVTHLQEFFHVFHPFSLFVWLSIVLAIGVLSLTLYISDWISPNEMGGNSNMFTPFESFFLVFSSFLMSKVETEPSKISSRLFTLLLWFSTLMYVTSYLSNLVSFMVKPVDTLTFTLLEELQETSGYRWGFLEGSAVVRTVQRRWPKLYDTAKREWPSYMFVSTYDEAIDRVLSDPTYVFIESADSLSFSKSRDCKLRLVKNVQESHYLTLLFRKGFPYQEQLNQQLQLLTDTRLAKMRSKYFELNRCYSGKIDIENKNQLGFAYLGGLFLFLGIGCGLAFLQILLHWVYARARQLIKHEKAVRLKFGGTYPAEVCKVTHEGLWIKVKGRKEMHFLSKSCLGPNLDTIKDATEAGIRAGDNISVKFYGKDDSSGNRIFVRDKTRGEKSSELTVGGADSSETSV